MGFVPSLAALLFGAAMAAAFWQLAGRLEFVGEIGKGFLVLGWREAFGYLAFLLLLLPGLTLAGWGAGGLAPRLPIAWREAAETRWWPLAGLVAAGWWLGARFARALLLADLPITDDEAGIEFGARIWLDGALSAPAFPAAWGIRMPYVGLIGERMASFDFPGGILAAAVAMASGLGPFFYGGLAALSALALAAACRRLGAWGGWLALGVLSVSPMVWTLAATQHAQLVSRSLVALVWAFYLTREGATGRSADLRALALGACAALAFLTRPAETAAALAPIAVHLLVEARRGRFRRFVTIAGAVSALGPLGHLLYGQLMLGSPLRQPRFLIGAGVESPPLVEALWARLGENAGFNLMMLLIFFVGPALIPLALAALGTGRTEAKVAAAALALMLGLGLLHDNTGLHLVGPIHYAETLAPLLVLVVLGSRPLAEGWIGRNPTGGVKPPLRPLHSERTASFPSNGNPMGSARPLSSDGESPDAEHEIALQANRSPGLFGAVVGYLAALALFGVVHARTLEDQASINAAPLAITADLGPAIVVADHYPKLWRQRGGFWQTGSGVIEYPHPRPDLADRVLFVNTRADLDALRRDFPERKLYRLLFAAEGEGPPLRLEAIPPALRPAIP